MRSDVARFWQRGMRLWTIALFMAATMLAVASVAVAADESPPGHVSPAFGPAAGGTSVTISGSGFTGATAVSFGGMAATAFTINTDTQIAATTPAHDAGAASVSVTRADGTTAVVGGYFFLPTATVVTPTVTSINPTTGSTAGHTPVVINGSGFQLDAHVIFGGTQATEVHVLADAIAIAMTPAHDAGPVDVVVTNRNGQSGTLGNGFTYATPAPAPAPTNTRVDPPTGSTGEHALRFVTIIGTGFQHGVPSNLTARPPSMPK